MNYKSILYTIITLSIVATLACKKKNDDKDNNTNQHPKEEDITYITEFVFNDYKYKSKMHLNELSYLSYDTKSINAGTYEENSSNKNITFLLSFDFNNNISKDDILGLKGQKLSTSADARIKINCKYYEKNSDEWNLFRVATNNQVYINISDATFLRSDTVDTKIYDIYSIAGEGKLRMANQSTIDDIDSLKFNMLFTNLVTNDYTQ